MRNQIVLLFIGLFVGLSGLACSNGQRDEQIIEVSSPAVEAPEPTLPSNQHVVPETAATLFPTPIDLLLRPVEVVVTVTPTPTETPTSIPSPQ